MGAGRWFPWHQTGHRDGISPEVRLPYSQGMTGAARIPRNP